MANDITIKDADDLDVDVATIDKAGREVQVVQLDGGDSSTVTPIRAGAGTAAAALRAVLASDDPAVALLTTIDSRVDGVETLLTAIDGHVDGIEGSVDGIETLIGATNTALATIDGRVDGVETLIGTTNSTLTTIDGRVDGIETLLTAIDGHVDGLEASAAAEAASLSVMDDWDENDRAKVNAQQVSGFMIENGVVVTVKRLPIACNTSGNNTLLAGVSGKKIRVLSMFLIATGTVSMYFTSDAAGTVIFGGSTHKIPLIANVGFVLPHNDHGWFQVETDAHALVLNLSGAVAVSGGFTYIEAE